MTITVSDGCVRIKLRKNSQFNSFCFARCFDVFLFPRIFLLTCNYRLELLQSMIFIISSSFSL